MHEHVNSIVHRILPHCQQIGRANGFLPKYLFCGALAAGYQINSTLKSVPIIW